MRTKSTHGRPDGRLSDGILVHLNNRDVTLICISQAPLGRLLAYKQQRGWAVPWASAHGSEFLFDYGYAFRRQEMSGLIRDEFDMGQLLREAPQWLRARVVGKNLVTSRKRAALWSPEDAPLTRHSLEGRPSVAIPRFASVR